MSCLHNKHFRNNEFIVELRFLFVTNNSYIETGVLKQNDYEVFKCQVGDDSIFMIFL